MIEICDFAVGLSRQLDGRTIATERADHRLGHPLGVCGVISAFNFPGAVWSSNATLALICGDSVVWKPSEKTPPCRPWSRERCGALPAVAMVVGFWSMTVALPSFPLRVRPPWAAPLVRAPLPVSRARSSSSVATMPPLSHPRPISIWHSGPSPSRPWARLGQRCTTLRRLFVPANVYDRRVPRLSQVYASVKVGDPRQAGTLIGPLIDRRAFESMQRALAEAREAGGIVHGGERIAVTLR
jgi:aldehyde dehydrogenase (NAD+)